MSMHAHFYSVLAVHTNATKEMKTDRNQEDGRKTSQDSTAGSMGSFCSPETTGLADGVLQNQHQRSVAAREASRKRTSSRHKAPVMVTSHKGAKNL